MREHKQPSIAIDCVLFDPAGRLLLIQRGNPPFKGAYAFPGGFMDYGETTEEGCRRELLEETGIQLGRMQLIGVYSNPTRDPRQHVVGVAYLGLDYTGEPVAGDDAASARFVENWQDLELAFDHKIILQDAFNLKQKLGV